VKIPKKYLIFGVIVLFLVIIGINDIKSGKTVQSGNQVTQSENTGQKLESEEGNVTVSIKYLAGKSDGNTLVFEITLDTHSEPLDSFDFTKEITLERNGKSIAPLSVNPAGSEHHRTAEIAFTKIESPFTMVVANLAGINRREFTFSNL